jgi:PIN domain nuclease of toxin-antitoxin system
MWRGVADTHALVWYLAGDARLSAPARAAIETAERNGDQIGVSSMTLIEIVYLIELGRVHAATLDIARAAMERANAFLVEVPINYPIVQVLRTIHRAHVPEMPDRVIVATAVHLGVPLISRDRQIQAAGLVTIW